MVHEGFETYTGEGMKVVYVQERADEGLPPWRSVTEDQYFLDVEVHEVVPGRYSSNGFPLSEE